MALPIVGLVVLLGDAIKNLVADAILRWGFKVALVAAIVTCFLTAYAGTYSLIQGVYSSLPNSPFAQFSLQFLPDKWAVSTGVGIFTTAAVGWHMLNWWRIAFISSAQAAASK